MENQSSPDPLFSNEITPPAFDNETNLFRSGLAARRLSKQLWRFITIPSLIDILIKRRLFFAPPDSFKDPWEGYFSDTQLISLAKSLIANPPTGKLNVGSEEAGIEYIKMAFKHLRLNTYICCWHQNETDSEAMWSKYSGDHGISIVSTIGQVQKFKPENASYNYRFDEVQYFREGEALDSGNPVNAFFYKRKSFSYEQEVRAIIFNVEKAVAEAVGESKWAVVNEIDNGGYYLAIDPATLINRIIVHPEAPQWKVDAVTKMVEALGYSILVKKSNLFDKPVS